MGCEAGSGKSLLVSIVLPVHNGEPFIAAALQSMLDQTFAEFELIVLDDGSTDGTGSIVRTFTDDRLRMVSRRERLGISATLNEGIRLARGRYIARMDADDISQPERLARQVAFMQEHQDVGVCGAWVETFGHDQGAVWRFPADHDNIKAQMLFGPACAHPAVMIRKRMLDARGLRYDRTCEKAQDFELWWRCIAHAGFANIQEVLLKYRTYAPAGRRQVTAQQQQTLFRVWQDMLRAIGISPGPQELELHYALSRWQFQNTGPFLAAASAWLELLVERNRQAGVFSETQLGALLAARWYDLMRFCVRLGPAAAVRYLRSPLRRYLRCGRRETGLFLLRCLWRFSADNKRQHGKLF